MPDVMKPGTAIRHPKRGKAHGLDRGSTAVYGRWMTRCGRFAPLGMSDVVPVSEVPWSDRCSKCWKP